MAFTQAARIAQKAALAAKMERKRAAQKAGNAIVAEICSVNGVEMENLSVEAIEIIKKLSNDLKVAQTSIPAAERLAISAAEQQGMSMGSGVKEVFTGHYLDVERAVGDSKDPDWRNKPPKYRRTGYANNRVIIEPVMGVVSLPVYAYKIDLAPNQGEFVSINDTRFYHGMVGKFDEDTLRSVKDIIARGWAHEHNIRGSDENVYRPHQNRVISARG